MTAANPAFTPVAQSKTAALCRVLDVVPKGYHHYIAGTCPAAKIEKFARKLHAEYGIGCSPAQRITRKKQGLANAVLVLYWPPAAASYLETGLEAGLEAGLEDGQATDRAIAEVPVGDKAPSPHETTISWLLLTTEGAGAVHDRERLQSVLGASRLHWLGYELVRLSSRGRASWTWRRAKSEMTDWYALLTDQLRRRQISAVALTLQRISRQPGFSGVRQQGWDLCQFARSQGYAEPLPFLFYVQKVSHGWPMRVSRS